MFEPARVNCVRLLPRSPRAIFTGNGCARGNGSDRVYVDLCIRVAPRVGHGNRKRVYRMVERPTPHPCRVIPPSGCIGIERKAMARKFVFEHARVYGCRV